LELLHPAALCRNVPVTFTLGRMNAIKLRDELFSELHSEVLKPAGFRKKGAWSIRECGEVTQSFYLRSSRFSSKTEAPFWIDVQVFSERYHQLLFAPSPYKGPSEGTQCLVLRGLPSWSWPSKGMRIEPRTDIGQIKLPLFQSVLEQALPFLDLCRSHATVLESLLQEVEPPNLEVAGLYRLLGKDKQAHEYMDKAKASAKHENEVRFFELREAKMWPSHSA
jgi:hypothetical protein